MASQRALVAITGANGTIGYHCTLHALETGYRVRCVVRSESAAQVIRNGPSIQPHADRVEYCIVPDNTISGAYYEALVGVQYVIHVAGVWPRPHYHPDDQIYTPFINSMHNILAAAESAGTVKRIVFTQAGAGFVNRDDGDTLGTNMDRTLNESTPVDERSAAMRPPLQSPHHAYAAAKAFCMSYLKDARQHQRFPFSIAQVIPGTVIGPSELVQSSEDARAHMDRMTHAFLFNAPRAVYGFAFVHVRDCARVHVEALDEERVPSNELPDWFVAGATTPAGKTIEQIWTEVGDMIEADFADQVRTGVFRVGRDNWPINVPFRVDSSRTEKLLLGGNKFKSLVESVRETADWYRSILSARPLSSDK